MKIEKINAIYDMVISELSSKSNEKTKLSPSTSVAIRKALKKGILHNHVFEYILINIYSENIFLALSDEELISLESMKLEKLIERKENTVKVMYNLKSHCQNTFPHFTLKVSNFDLKDALIKINIFNKIKTLFLLRKYKDYSKEDYDKLLANIVNLSKLVTFHYFDLIKFATYTNIDLGDNFDILKLFLDKIVSDKIKINYLSYKTKHLIKLKCLKFVFDERSVELKIPFKFLCVYHYPKVIFKIIRTEIINNIIFNPEKDDISILIDQINKIKIFDNFNKSLLKGSNGINLLKQIMHDVMSLFFNNTSSYVKCDHIYDCKNEDLIKIFYTFLFKFTTNIQWKKFLNTKKIVSCTYYYGNKFENEELIKYQDLIDLSAIGGNKYITKYGVDNLNKIIDSRK